jgi:hypothetical protein
MISCILLYYLRFSLFKNTLQAEVMPSVEHLLASADIQVFTMTNSCSFNYSIIISSYSWLSIEGLLPFLEGGMTYNLNLIV